MATTIDIAVYTNSDDAFVAWKPSEFIPGCRGFLLERARKVADAQKVEIVQNRVGFAADKPTEGEHRPSDEWPFQRFNWTDHAVDVGNEVRYRVTAMIEKGKGRPYAKGPASKWTQWATLTADAGDGFSCYFNRGLILSQFVARYLKKNKLTPGDFKRQLQKSVDPKFREFLQGDLGDRLEALLAAGANGTEIHAALYELGDAKLEDELIAVGDHLHLILANGSNKTGDGNKTARSHLNRAGIATIDRLLGSKGLGHNKFAVLSTDGEPDAVWTGSTNWSTTGLCTQVNNGLLIKDRNVAAHFLAHWDDLRKASPPVVKKANFTDELIAANDEPHTFEVGGARVEVWFTPMSNGQDMQALRDLIQGAEKAILFLMFTPGAQGLHTLAAQRAGEAGMYVRGVVSTLGNTAADNDKNVLDIQLVSSDRKFKPDRYSVVQPQGVAGALGNWIGEVTRKDFLAQVGHAIVHSKVLVIDPLSEKPVIVTGSHNFSASASKRNDENLVIIRNHQQLARAYATCIMSVYQHYRYRSYVREAVAACKKPWSFLENDDRWMREEMESRTLELGYWT